MWHTYILQCSDDSFYAGHTNELSRRLAKHNEGQETKWTACRLLVRLVYHESHEEENSATERERQIKKWSRAKKEVLIAGNTENLKKTKHT